MKLPWENFIIGGWGQSSHPELLSILLWMLCESGEGQGWGLDGDIQEECGKGGLHGHRAGARGVRMLRAWVEKTEQGSWIGGV